MNNSYVKLECILLLVLIGRIRILHNIAIVFIRMGQWEEAVSSLEYIMNEQASHRSGLHLVLCCMALEDRDRIRNAFSLLLSVPLNIEDEDKYNHDQVSIFTFYLDNYNFLSAVIFRKIQVIG